MTPRQKEVYDFVVKRIRNGLPPTIREIGNEFGININAAAMRYLLRYRNAIVFAH